MLFLKGHLKESDEGEGNTDKGLAGMSGECDQQKAFGDGCCRMPDVRGLEQLLYSRWEHALGLGPSPETE